MTEDRDYIARVEARKDAEYRDMNALAAAIEGRGYQVETNPSNGSLEVYRA